MLHPASEDGRATTVPAPRQEQSRLNVGWIMPPFVRELPVNAPDSETAAEQLHALATEALPDRPVDEQYRFAAALASQLDPMLEANVIYAGLCLLEVDGRPSGSTVVVSQIPHESDDEDELLRTTQELLQLAHPDDDYQRVELPCGPALTRIGASGFIITAEWSPTGQDVAIQQSQIQVYIPLPGAREMLIFALDSPSHEDWDLHSELFAEILKTIDWGTDQDIEDYRAMRQSAPAAAEPDESVQRELFWHSSRLLDVIALQGRTRSAKRVNSVTCEECWGKGLRSACSARHRWQIDPTAPADLAGALIRVTAAFSSQGWETEPTGDDTRVRLRAGSAAAQRSVGYSFTVSVDAAAGSLSAEVVTPCSRTSAAVDSAFG